MKLLLAATLILLALKGLRDFLRRQGEEEEPEIVSDPHIEGLLLERVA